MLNDNENILNYVKKIREAIYDECQKNADFAPKEYQECCVRILNAEIILYNDTLDIIYHNSAAGTNTNLSLSSLIELQNKISNILLEPENIIKKEKQMRKLFAEQKMPPKSYFKLDYKTKDLLSVTIETI
jgi:hypothetical protein